MEYLRVNAEGATGVYVESDGLQGGVADKELMGMAIGSVAGLAARPATPSYLSERVIWTQ